MDECKISPSKISFCGVHEDHLSVKVYHPTLRQEIISFLRSMHGLAINNINLAVQIKTGFDRNFKFYCTVASINSKKNAVSFLMHTKKGFDVLQGIYKLIGRNGLEMVFRRWRNSDSRDNAFNRNGNAAPHYGEVDIYGIRQEVSNLIKALSKDTGKAKEDMLLELTTFTKDGKTVQGKRDIDLLSYCLIGSPAGEYVVLKTLFGRA